VSAGEIDPAACARLAAKLEGAQRVALATDRPDARRPPVALDWGDLAVVLALLRAHERATPARRAR
jgi:hypothetical protein